MTDEQKFIVARWAYSVGRPVISDAEYTQLLNYFQSTKPDWEYVTRSWSSDPCPTDLLKEVGREDLIQAVTLSDKTESIPSLNSWAEVVDTYQHATFNNATISYKHDGWNVQATYYNGELISINTRGRSSDALDVGVLKPLYPQTIPQMGRVKVIGECTVSRELFKELKSKFGNVLERSAVRTALARPEYALRLTVHCFDIMGVTGLNIFPTLMQWGFKVPTWDTVVNYDDLQAKIRQFDARFDSYEYPADGLVVAIESNRRAIRVGAWEEPIYKSYVTSYEESYGPYAISMKVAIKPIHTNKGMQYRIPLTNLARIVENDLQIGSPIAFNTVSGAIADFNPEVTKLLHEQWYGQYGRYRAKIDREEELYGRMADSN